MLVRSLSAICVYFCVTAGAVTPNLGENAQDSDDASLYLREAYFAGLKGDYNARERLLVAAQEASPNLELAHWQNGEILVDGEWMPIASVQAAAAEDKRIARYQQLVDSSDDSLQSQLQLARWCRRARLTDEARIHWQRVLQELPEHPEALRALGLRLINGEYLAVEEVADSWKANRADRKAERAWKLRVAQWKRASRTSQATTRDEIHEQISQINDPQAIVAIESWTVPEWGGDEEDRGDADAALAFVIALSNMQNDAAVESLVRHGLASEHEVVRESAATALSERSMYAYVPNLLDILEQPIESNWNVTLGTDGDVGYSHTLYQRGAFVDREVENRSQLRQFDPVDGRRSNLDRTNFDIANLAGATSSRFNQRAANVEVQVAEANERLAERNERVASLLNFATGESFGSDPDEWWEWWSEHTATELPESRPTNLTVTSSTSNRFYETPIPATPDPPSPSEFVPPITCECFVAGTMVWAKTGLVPIETLGAGDLVLSQDTETGELAFRAVLERTVRRPSPTMRIEVGDETITATIGHPFWRMGEGWQMAKELEEGNVVATVQSPITIKSTVESEIREAHNLIVEGFATYFVGETGLLVHDGTPTPDVKEVAPGVKRN